MTITLTISGKKIKSESCDSEQHAEKIRDAWKELYREEMNGNDWEIFRTIKSGASLK